MKKLVFGRNTMQARNWAREHYEDSREVIYVMSEYSFMGLTLRDASVVILAGSEENPLFGQFMSYVNGPRGPKEVMYVRDLETERHYRDYPDMYPADQRHSTVAPII